MPHNADRRPAEAKAAIQEQAGQPQHSLDPDRLLTWIDAYLLGWQRGYESRVDEENAAWPPSPVKVFGKWYSQAEQRQAWDEAVRREVAS